MGTYVISFESTHAAMAASKALTAAGIKFMTIPLPTAISAGCGMAAMFDSSEPLKVFKVATSGSSNAQVASLYERLGKQDYNQVWPE